MSDTVHIHRKAGRWNATALRALMDVLPDGSYTLTLKAGATKSHAQNNYLHQLFTIAAKALNREAYGTGERWTPEQVKTYCKAARLYPMKDVTMPGGVVEQLPMDTRALSKDDAMYTIDKVIAHFEELGIHLPAPGEQIELLTEP
jgi:hypothetical protein